MATSVKSDLSDPYNPNSLLSLLDPKEKKRISKSNSKHLALTIVEEEVQIRRDS